MIDASVNLPRLCVTGAHNRHYLGGGQLGPNAGPAQRTPSGFKDKCPTSRPCAAGRRCRLTSFFYSASYTDRMALTAFAKSVDSSLRVRDIPTSALLNLPRFSPQAQSGPGRRAPWRLAQEPVKREKEFLRDLGFQTAPFARR